MAVKIRLKRIGEKKVPMYRIVVAEASTPRNGRAALNNTDQEVLINKFGPDSRKGYL